MDVAAKTGTTNDNYDRWLCGFTPYYTSVTWFGFDKNETVNFNGKNPAGIIWSNIMKKIHSNLAGKKFEMTKNIVTATICYDSGKIANSNCPKTFTEYFLKGTIPNNCTQHSGSSIPTTTKSKNKSTSTTNSTSSNTSQSNNVKENNSVELNSTQENTSIKENVNGSVQSNNFTTQNKINTESNNQLNSTTTNQNTTLQSNSSNTTNTNQSAVNDITTNSTSDANNTNDL